MGKTKIEWCDRTINPVVGCSKCSPGCDNCYAERRAVLLAKNPATAKKYKGVVNSKGRWTGKINVGSVFCFDNLPKKPARIFINSMSDLFHENMEFSVISTIFGLMALHPQHTFIVLTKRPDRMHSYFQGTPDLPYAASFRDCYSMVRGYWPEKMPKGFDAPWPLPNVWLGVTVCNQKEANEKMYWLAFALQDDGWFLRSDIIWHKPNPMPESCKDRPTRAHEYLFLFSKRAKYFYDWEAVREPAAALCEHDATGSGYAAPGQTSQRGNRPRVQSAQALSFARAVNEPERPGQAHSQHRPNRNPRPGIDTRGGNQGTGGIPAIGKGNAKTFRGGGAYTSGNSFDNAAEKERDSHGNAPNLTYMRNKRTVWTIPTFPCPDAHFATFPPKLAETCILAGSRHGDTVLDPFMGSGTTGMVARQYGRKWIGIELNPEYCALALKRIDVNRLMLTELV